MIIEMSSSLNLIISGQGDSRLLTAAGTARRTAIYGEALEPAAIDKNADLLLASDDR